MPEWHASCGDEQCHYRCRRPDCARPGQHFLVKVHWQDHRYVGFHGYDCSHVASLAVQVAEELRPGMAPDEVAIARRVLLEALDRLETVEKQRPVIYRESA